MQCSWFSCRGVLCQLVVPNPWTGEDFGYIRGHFDSWIHYHCYNPSICCSGWLVRIYFSSFIVLITRVRFFILGAGMSINLAIGQVFCANLANNTVMTGLYQGAYGLGGTIAPLIATSMLSRGYMWSRFYIILVGLAAFNLCFAAWAFWKYEDESDPALPSPTTGRGDRSQIMTSSKRRWSSLKTLLCHRTTILGAMFIFAYQVSLRNSNASGIICLKT